MRRSYSSLLLESKSRSRAALEGWLADTEALLADQREQSISLSIHGFGYGERHETTINMSALAAGLTELLSRLSRILADGSSASRMPRTRATTSSPWRSRTGQ